MARDVSLRTGVAASVEGLFMHPAVKRESRLALKYAAVSGLGFLTDATMLHLCLALGLEPAWARVASLICAMHVTFVVNGLVVFRRLTRATLVGHWARYIAVNALGNLCNYFIFVAFVSSRWPVISLPMVALTSGSLAAWTINYLTTRLWVFRDRVKARGCTVSKAQAPPPSTNLT